MATKKRASTAKVTKKAVAKKVVRKAPKKSSKSSFADDNMKSFVPYKEPSEFLSLRITRQTIYWSALLIYTLCLSLWVLKIQTDILDILNLMQ